MAGAARKPYPADLTGGPWELMQIVIPDARPGGRPRSVDMREVVNALLYLNRAGCQWDMLPHDLPAESTVYEYFAGWPDDGTWQATPDALREAYRENHARSGEPAPGAGSADSQTVKGAEVGGERGYDGGETIRGRRRHIGVDALGLLLAVAVAGAGVGDARAAAEVLGQLDGVRRPRLEVVWADSKYHNHDLTAGKARPAEVRWRPEVVSRPVGAKGFVLLPKRWVAERTFAGPGRAGRLSRDDEWHTTSSECMARIRGIEILLNRMAPKDRYAPFKYRDVKS